jgi:hypothetical protein
VRGPPAGFTAAPHRALDRPRATSSI